MHATFNFNLSDIDDSKLYDKYKNVDDLYTAIYRIQEILSVQINKDYDHEEIKEARRELKMFFKDIDDVVITDYDIMSKAVSNIINELGLTPIL